MATISLKLLVDKHRNRELFAESNEDFVDILFSFLTLLMGTIIRLLGKQSLVGCMDRLYESVENLDTKYLETEACKTMLLQPRSEAERLCEDLVVNVDNLQPGRLYRCPSFDCFSKTHRLYSSFCGTRCHCGKAMDINVKWKGPKLDDKGGVFLDGVAKYIISDDLNVALPTMSNALSVGHKLGVEDAENLETRTVNMQKEEVLSLLKAVLMSKMPLTEVFLQNMESDSDDDGFEFVEIDRTELECEKETIQAKNISVKLLQNRATKEVVYAEVGNDFVDILLSFLTFALGSIIELLNKQSSVGCADNLYRSVEALAANHNLIKLECKNKLLSPKLYPHFSCSNQLIRIEENLSKKARIFECATCFSAGVITSSSKCKHGIDVVRITEINPKLPNLGTEIGGGYAKSSVKFMITNEMAVRSYSVLSGFELITELKEPIGSLAEKVVSVGETQALNLLRACLTSRTALTDVFIS